MEGVREILRDMPIIVHELDGKLKHQFQQLINAINGAESLEYQPFLDLTERIHQEVKYNPIFASTFFCKRKQLQGWSISMAKA